MIKIFFLGIMISIRSAADSQLINQALAANDTLINVGDHKLHFVVRKAGEPAILLEAGGGADASQWDSVQNKLSTETNATIISYDRAGFGKSELPNTPYNLIDETKDLHKCLKILGVEKMVLVGHSYGAFLNQAYQFLYHDEVRAIVLVDPNNTIFVDSIGVRILMHFPFDTTKPMTSTQRADVRQTIALANTVDLSRKMPYSNKIPITIISAGKDWWAFPQWNKWWKNSHQTIVNGADNRTLIIANGSGHNIPKENPDKIVGVIKDVLRIIIN